MKEDIGQQIIDKLDKINLSMDKTHYKIHKKVEEKKNSHIHIMISTKEKKKLMDKAEEEGLDFSEWCRRKLKKDSQLNRIENKIDDIVKNAS